MSLNDWLLSVSFAETNMFSHITVSILNTPLNKIYSQNKTLMHSYSGNRCVLSNERHDVNPGVNIIKLLLNCST